ncbi:hypothetical protein [Sporosarcina sp. FSL W7-1283]|uniref:hypothetical protein n=1 Tax=Sporosarcina sp. FSL W7-1283 TaxID=2921560 RepID=UPI0030FA2CE0
MERKKYYSLPERPDQPEKKLYKTNRESLTNQTVDYNKETVKHLQQSTEGLPCILTDIKELEDKILILIDHDEMIESYTLYFTDDNCLLVEYKYTSRSMGVNVVKTKIMDSIEDIYEHYGDELVNWGIITRQTANRLQEELQQKENLIINKKQDELDYVQYLRLKKKFEKG